jgi:hypothetical protein
MKIWLFARAFITMKTNCAMLVTAVFLVLAAGQVSNAVNTREIDEVREKRVLDKNDLNSIDEFIAEAVEEIIRTKDFTGVGSIRSAVLSRAVSSTASAAAQYKEQFLESSYKHISAGLKEAAKLIPTDLRFKVTVNLLILADSLESLRLANAALGLLNDDNAAVRYWAVHCVTNSGFIKRLNAERATASKLADQITEQLKNSLPTDCPETLTLIAAFATEVKTQEAEDLLLAIADMRISKYITWNVNYTLLDADILKLLCDKILSDTTNKSAFAQRFARLYSCVIQRYVKGQDILSAAEKNQLISVLLETEQSCIGKLLDIPQSIIQKAVEQNDLTALMLEHNRLLGDETSPGKLALKLDFDYGKTTDGSKRLAPLALPEPPK